MPHINLFFDKYYFALRFFEITKAAAAEDTTATTETATVKSAVSGAAETVASVAERSP